MGQCIFCSRKSLFLRLNQDGLCGKCEEYWNVEVTKKIHSLQICAKIIENTNNLDMKEQHEEIVVNIIKEFEKYPRNLKAKIEKLLGLDFYEAWKRFYLTSISGSYRLGPDGLEKVSEEADAIAFPLNTALCKLKSSVKMETKEKWRLIALELAKKSVSLSTKQKQCILSHIQYKGSIDSLIRLLENNTFPPKNWRTDLIITESAKKANDLLQSNAKTKS